jgi:hypothetical protein
MKYVVDIDGTICSNTYGKYEEAVPFLDRIDGINKLYDEGHEIWYFTARGMSENPTPSKATIQWHKLTKKQLEDWGCKYHHLYMGKPTGDYYIDDKGISDIDFFK